MFIETQNGDFVAMSKIEFLGVRNNAIYASGPEDIDDDIRVVSLGYFENYRHAKVILNEMTMFMAINKFSKIYRVPDDDFSDEEINQIEKMIFRR